MAKLQPKAVVKPFASEETNPNFEPTPVGQWAGGGAVTPSLDPEVLLENASQGITKMTVQSGTSTIILPPASDIAGLYYSFTYFLKALQQTGIAEYSAVQDYHANDITKAPSGSKIYRSLINNNIGNPLTDITKWEELDLLALKQATIIQRGTLQIATTSDINTGTDNTKALTIANLRASNINFTGTPTAPTQATSDNSTKLATTQHVKQNLVNYAPLLNPNFVGGNIKLTNNFNNGLTSIINFTNPATPNNTLVVLRFTPDLNIPNVYQDILNVLFVNGVLQATTLPNASLTGTPTAPTQATSDNSTKIATTEYVNNKIASEKKFGIDVAGKISFVWNVVFTAPSNGSIKILVDVNSGGSFDVLIDGVVAWTDTSFVSQKTYNYVIPIAKNQTFSINKNSLVNFQALLFFPYKF